MQLQNAFHSKPFEMELYNNSPVFPSCQRLGSVIQAQSKQIEQKNGERASRLPHCYIGHPNALRVEDHAAALFASQYDCLEGIVSAQTVQLPRESCVL